MASFGASSSRQVSLLEPKVRSAQSEFLPPQDLEPEPWGKRFLAAFVRRLRNNSFVLSTIVQAFRALQRAGISVTPNHFYWPVPDLRELEKREWPVYSAPPGCDFRLHAQVNLAREFKRQYVAELAFDSQPEENSF